MEFAKKISAAVIICLCLSCSSNEKQAKETKTTGFETVHFLSGDSLQMTADVYEISKTAPTIVLCHQARFSRGEYRETAPLLNEWGFNCIALDQRSGGEANEVVNETAAEAKKKNLPTEYLDAEKDIIAGVNYAFQRWGNKVVLLGSSYSAGLSLKVAMENENVKTVIAFSPGEYFGVKLNLTKTITGLSKPCFLTSSKKESEELRKLATAITSPVIFTPTGDGEHGSKAMWSKTKGFQEYRTALKEFLRGID